MLAVSFQGAPCGNGDLIFAFPSWGDFKIMNGSLLPSGPHSAMTTASIRWLFNPNLTQASDAVPPGQLHHLWMAAPRPARTSGDWPASTVKANPVRAQEQRVLGGGLCPRCCLGRPRKASCWVPRGC